MSNIKISQLNNATTPLAGTEVVPIVQSGSTKKVSVSNIVAGKQDTLVSGTNIKTVNSTSLLGSGDVAVQPTLVSGTNIKTINGSSVLGSGDLSISGGLSGIHTILPIATTEVTSFAVNSVSLTSTNTAVDRIYCHPYIPNQSITTSNLFINIQGGTAGGLARIAIYSDLNGLPNNQLYISSNLDCSTGGNKTATTTFNFVAGVKYWLIFHSNSNSISINAIPSSGLLPIKSSSANGSTFGVIGSTNSFASGTPNPIPSFFNLLSNMPFIGITKA